VKLEFSSEQDALAELVAGIAQDAREKGWFNRSAGMEQAGGGDIVEQLAGVDLLRLGLPEPLGVGGGWVERAIVAEQLGRAGYRGQYFDAQAAVLVFSQLGDLDDEVRKAAAGSRFLAVPGLYLGPDRARLSQEPARAMGVEGAPHATHVMWLRGTGEEAQLAIASVGGSVSVRGQHSVDGDAIGVVDLPPATDAPTVLTGERAEKAWNELRTGMAVLRSAEMAGACGTLIERTVEHAMDRIVFGRPIAAFQAAQHALAKAEIQRRAARLLTYRAASQLEAGGPARERSAAMALLIACDALLECARVASQINGGTGFIVEHWLPDYYARAKALDLRTGGRPVRVRRVRDSILATRAAGLSMQQFWQWGL